MARRRQRRRCGQRQGRAVTMHLAAVILGVVGVVGVVGKEDG